jgi:hypothetical protein
VIAAGRRGPGREFLLEKRQRQTHARSFGPFLEHRAHFFNESFYQLRPDASPANGNSLTAAAASPSVASIFTAVPGAQAL